MPRSTLPPRASGQQSAFGCRGGLQRLPLPWGQGRQGCVLQPGLRRSLCWASVCPSACLSVILKEAGAGPAAAWAEQLLRGTHGRLLSVWLQTHYFTSTIHLTFKVNMRHHFPSMGKTREVRHGSRVSREWAWLETDLKVV